MRRSLLLFGALLAGGLAISNYDGKGNLDQSELKAPKKRKAGKSRVSDGGPLPTIEMEPEGSEDQRDFILEIANIDAVVAGVGSCVNDATMAFNFGGKDGLDARFDHLSSCVADKNFDYEVGLRYANDLLEDIENRDLIEEVSSGEVERGVEVIEELLLALETKVLSDYALEDAERRRDFLAGYVPLVHTVMYRYAERLENGEGTDRLIARPVMATQRYMLLNNMKIETFGN